MNGEDSKLTRSGSPAYFLLVAIITSTSFVQMCARWNQSDVKNRRRSSCLYATGYRPLVFIAHLSLEHTVPPDAPYHGDQKRRVSVQAAAALTQTERLESILIVPLLQPTPSTNRGHSLQVIVPRLDSGETTLTTVSQYITCMGFCQEYLIHLAPRDFAVFTAVLSHSRRYTSTRPLPCLHHRRNAHLTISIPDL